MYAQTPWGRFKVGLDLRQGLLIEPDRPGLLRTPAVTEALLPAIALYGANASGKSNVLQAMSFARHAVTSSHRAWEPDAGVPVEPFMLSDEAEAPSTYEFDLIINDVRHRYGLVLTAAAVADEWLYAWPHGKRQVWFERNGDAFEFGKHLPGENETIRALTRPNSLFSRRQHRTTTAFSRQCISGSAALKLGSVQPEVAIQRRPPRREQKHRILIVCEGRETEPTYFIDFRNDVRNPRVHVEPVAGAGVPMKVVNRAIELRDEAMKRAGAEKDETHLWDEVWAVVDVDEHPNVSAAKQLATSKGIC